MKSKTWFEIWWWPPNWGTWELLSSHKTQEAAEKTCERAYREQPHVSFQIRKSYIHKIYRRNKNL